MSALGLSLFNVAHIFPFAREQTWVDQNMSKCITDTASPEQQGPTKIHSVQNGLLLRADVHGLFDAYGVSVNVDVRDPEPFQQEQEVNTTIGRV